MRNFGSLLASSVERVVPRLSSAALLLVLVAYSTPTLVGYFALGTLLLTLFQGTLESALRQVAPSFVGLPESRQTFARLVRVSCLVAAAVLVALTVAVLLVTQAPVVVIASLALIGATLPASALGIVAVARLELAEKWSVLARYRFISSVGAGLLCVAGLVITGEIVFSAAYPVLSEFAYSLFSRRLVKNLEPGSPTKPPPAMKSEVMVLAAYGLLGWSESQADRVLVGAVGGPSTLGYYTTASSVGRSGGDSVSMGVAVVTRARLAASTADSSHEHHRDVVRRTVAPAIFINAAGSLAVTALAVFVLPRLYGAEWLPSWHAAALLSTATIPALLTWNFSMAAISRGQSKRLIPIRVIGLVLSVGVAAAAIRGVETAALAVVVRDIVVCAAVLLVARRFVRPAVVLLALGAFVVCFATVALATM